MVNGLMIDDEGQRLLANLAQHLLVCLILYRFLRRLAVPGALPAVAVFGLHPVCVETVAWISEQKNTLSTAFCLAAALAYSLLVQMIVRANGRDSAVAAAVGSDRKGNVSVLFYVLAIGLAWVSRWIAYALYVSVAFVWFVPDRRIETVVKP